MKHKTLLALFLFSVIILSSKIVSISNNEIIQVKKVNTNMERYTIQSIIEEDNGIKIKIFYPVTKYDEVNAEILEEIEKYKKMIKESTYVSDNKFLNISFEDYINENMIGFEFNVEYNEGLYHNKKESFKIEYCEEED